MTNTRLASSYQLRSYLPGDESGQVAIYNAATRTLPGFKMATVDEVLRRYRSPQFDPGTKLYAFQDGQMVAYVSFSENGRVSVPWCLPEAVDAGQLLMDSMLTRLRERGVKRAWAAYRGDWDGVRRTLESFGFRIAHEITNFVEERAKLPHEAAQLPFKTEPLRRDQVAAAFALDRHAFEVDSAEALAEAWLDGPYVPSDSLFALHDGLGQIAGVAIAIVNAQYADATKIDSAMPCFRLGAIGTELERTKRVNGFFSYLARPGAENDQLGRWLLAEACRRFEMAGLGYVAAQCPSDRQVEMSFYRRYFQPQKSFPIFARTL